MKKIKATEHAYSTVEKIDNHVIQLEKIMLDGIDEKEVKQFRNTISKMTLKFSKRSQKMDKNYEIVEFKNGEFKLDVSVTPNSDTVWLNVNQMSKLFNKNKSTILRHIKNILAEELDDREVVAKFATTFSHGSVKGKHKFMM